MSIISKTLVMTAPLPMLRDMRTETATMEEACSAILMMNAIVSILTVLR